MNRAPMGITAATLLLAGACLAMPARAADADDGEAKPAKHGFGAFMGKVGHGLKDILDSAKDADPAAEAPAPPTPPTPPAVPEPAVAKPTGIPSPAATPAALETTEAEGLGSTLKGLAGSALVSPVEAHDYEAPLTRDDRICTQEVDPFKLSDNVEDVLKKTAHKRLDNFLIQIGAKKEKSDPEKTMAEFRAAARRLNWMPLPLEVRYGASLHKRHAESDPQFLARSNRKAVKRKYANADALLAKVLSQVEGKNPYHFQVFLETNAQVNASAAPGGYIYMSTAALDSGFADLILAHEVAHVLKRHETRELQARLVDLVHTHEELKALLKERHPKPAQMAMRAASLVGTFVHHSRQQELQADACSVRIVAAGTDRDMDALVDDYVAALEADVGSTRKWYHISTHPDYPDRAKRMKEVVAALRVPEPGTAPAAAETAEADGAEKTPETAVAAAPKDAAPAAVGD